jgi:hypothetical protein
MMFMLAFYELQNSFTDEPRFALGDYMQTSLVIQQTTTQSRLTNTTAIRATGPVSRVNL